MASKAKKKVGFKDFTPTKPLLGVVGDLYPKDCFLWGKKPDEAIVHDLSLAHNQKSKKFEKGAKSKAKGEEAKAEETERDVFIAHLCFIAFGTTPAGSTCYPRLVDLAKTPKEQAAAVNAVVAYMQAHFAGVGAQVLRTQVEGK